MRWALLLAAGCLVCVGQPGNANTFALKLSKPNGTWSQYLDDVGACNPNRPRVPVSNGPYHFALDKGEILAHSERYFGCMASKGYRADPNGYRAGRYLQVGDTDILVPRWK